MRIQTLIVNNRGFYSQNRASKMSAVSVVPETVRNDQLRALHESYEASTSQQPDLEAIYESVSPRRFQEIVFASKYLHKLIAANGVIDQIETLAVVNPYDKEAFDKEGWLTLSEPTPYGDTYKFYMNNKMHDERLIKAAHLKQVENFVEDFLNAKYPEAIVFKPDMAANADGQIRLERRQDHVIIKIYDASGGDLSKAFLARSFTVKNTCRELEELELVSESNYKKVFKLDLNDRSIAANVLAKVLKSSLENTFREEQNPMGFFLATGPQGLKQECDSALVEKEEELLKLDGKIIEGRFFLTYSDLGPQLTYGQRSDPSSGRIILGPSFMKYGKSESDVVNMGDKDKDWPAMVEDIIKARGLEIDKNEYLVYLETLLKSQLLHIREGVNKLCLGRVVRHPIQIDIAWDAKETMQVPKASGDGFITVPRPILMEWNYTSRY